MAHIKPQRVQYSYRVACEPDGSPYVGHYEDGAAYFNVLAERVAGRITNPQRIIARTETLEKAQRLVQVLTECTARGDA